jgi:hypothetical protein
MADASADEWWQGAESELQSAELLRNNGSVDQAYLHAGQAIEFALKALIMKRKNWRKWPDNFKGANWHDLKTCAEAANLKYDLGQKGVSKELKANWLTVRDWKSNARYPGMKISRQDINDLLVAVCNKQNGVWQWLTKIYHRS